MTHHHPPELVVAVSRHPAVPERGTQVQTAELVAVAIAETHVQVQMKRRSAIGNGTETVGRTLRAAENLPVDVKVVEVRIVGRRILTEVNEIVGIDMGIAAGGIATVIGTETTSGIGMGRENGSVVEAGEKRRGRGSVIGIENVTGIGIGATRTEETGRRKVVLAVEGEAVAVAVEVEVRGRRRLRRWTREVYLSGLSRRQGRGMMRTWARGGEERMTMYVSYSQFLFVLL